MHIKFFLAHIPEGNYTFILFRIFTTILFSLPFAFIYINEKGRTFVLETLYYIRCMNTIMNITYESSHIQLYKRNFLWGYVLRKILCAPEKMFLPLERLSNFPFSLRPPESLNLNIEHSYFKCVLFCF